MNLRNYSVLDQQQALLTWLHKHPRSTRNDIVDAFGIARSTTITYLRNMRAAGLVERTEHKVGRYVINRYTALAAEVSGLPAPAKAAQISGTRSFVSKGPWHTGNRCSDTEPTRYPAQGGQGGNTGPRFGTYLETNA